jgi:hypothetical protein
MIKVKAVKTTGDVVKGKEYYVGGVMQRTNNLVLMEDTGKDEKGIVRGSYNSEEIFNTTTEDIMKKIKQEGK